jgi:hypothetical protein
MKFTFEGQEYSFYFHLGDEEEKTTEIQAKGGVVDCNGNVLGGGANEHVAVYLTKTQYPTECHLLVRDESAERGWRKIQVHTAWSSAKDQFWHKIGRDVALGKFMHDNPFVKYESVRGKDKKHLRWEFVSGDIIQGHRFYAAMRTAWKGRFDTSGRKASRAGSFEP